MNKKWKQTLALCLALILLLGAAPLTAAAKTSIPADAQKYNGHSYKVYDLSMTWTEAKAYCERLGGHLVTITSAEEQSLISLMVYVKEKDYYWIGAQKSNGSLSWITGEHVTYSNWDHIDQQEQHDIALVKIDGNWFDHDDILREDPFDYLNAGFICEWETTNKNVKSVSVDDMTINYKQNTTLRPVIEADNGSTVVVTYESMNPAAVTVDEYGNIYGAKPGIADIKVTVEDETGKAVSDTCTVTVKYSPIQWIIVIVLFGWIWY